MNSLFSLLLSVCVFVATAQNVDSITRIDSSQLTATKLGVGIIDSARDAAYFASAAGSSVISKVKLSTFSEVDTVDVGQDQGFFTVALLDQNANIGFFASGYKKQAFKVDLLQMKLTGNCTLPYGLGTVAVGLLDTDHNIVYLAGNEGNNYLFKIPYAEFTAIANPTELPFLRFDVGNIVAGCLDPGNRFAYFATDGASGTLIQVDLDPTNSTSDPTVVDSIDLPEGVGKISGALCNLKRKLMYFYTNSDPALLIKVDLSNTGTNTISALNLTDPNAFSVLKLASINRNIAAGAIDTQGGQVYLGTLSSPGRAVHVDVGVWGEISSIRLNSGEDSISAVLLDADNHLAYYASKTADPGIVVKVALPPACPNNCFGRGVCDYSYCNCIQDPRWTGRSCNLLLCPKNCTDKSHGICNNGTCLCGSIWKGSNCSIRTCPNECSLRGTCNETNNFTCVCQANWAGEDCSQVAPVPPCDQLLTCDKCFSNASCGWCADEGTCYYLANLDSPEIGPAGTGCYSWHYDTCPVVGLEVLAWILTAIAAIMLLVNFVSATHEDLTTPAGRPTDVQIRRSWWRNQRSAKTWYLIDRMQFTAITCMFSVQFHTVYMTFCNIFKWTLLGYRLPWSIYDTEHPTYSQRMLLSFKQWGTWMKAYQEEIYLGHLFWFAIILGGLVVCGLIVNLVAAVVSSENFKNMAKNRFLYVGLRLFLFGYWSITVTAWYHVTLDMEDDGERKTALVIAIFTLVVFSVGLPLGVFLGLRGKKKELFNKTFRQRYGCLYNCFYFKKSFYMAVVLAKKFIVALFVGTLNDHEAPLLAVLLVIYIGYLVQLIFSKPYLDHVHFFMEIAVSIIDIVILTFMFVFLDGVTNETAQLAIGVILVVLHIIAMVIIIAAFVNSWFKLKNIHTLKQFIKALQGKHDDSAGAGAGTQMTTIAAKR